MLKLVKLSCFFINSILTAKRCSTVQKKDYESTGQILAKQTSSKNVHSVPVFFQLCLQHLDLQLEPYGHDPLHNGRKNSEGGRVQWTEDQRESGEGVPCAQRGPKILGGKYFGSTSYSEVLSGSCDSAIHRRLSDRRKSDPKH